MSQSQLKVVSPTHRSHRRVYMTLTPKVLPTPVSRTKRVMLHLGRLLIGVLVGIVLVFVISSALLGAPAVLQSYAHAYQVVFGQDDDSQSLPDEDTLVVEDCVLPDDGQDHAIPADCLYFAATAPEIVPPTVPPAPTVPPQANQPVTDIVCGMLVDSTEVGYLALPHVMVTAQGAGNVGYLTGLTIGTTVTITYETVVEYYPSPDGTQISHEVYALTGLTVVSWDVDKSSFNTCQQGE